MQWIAGSGMDGATYINVLASTSFIIYLVGVAMIELFERTRIDGVEWKGGDEEGNGGSGWGRRLPAWFGRRSEGSSVGVGGEEYESVPLASTSTTRSRSNGSEDVVFELGDDDEHESDQLEDWTREEKSHHA